MNGPNGKPTNAWVTLGKFCRTGVGVGTIILTTLSGVGTGAFLVGGRILRAIEMPELVEGRLEELESYDATHLDIHSDMEALRDSVFAVLSGSDSKLQLFFDLYRCTEAGYAAHECPLLGDELGIEPLAPNEGAQLFGRE